MSRAKINYSALSILLLSAALVSISALYVYEKTKQQLNTTVADKRSSKPNENARYQWKLITSWPKNFPGIGMAPEYLAKKVAAMSSGRFTIKVFGANEIAPALGVFDAVSNGSVQAGHSGSYYWKGKIPASVFFTTIPFGMNAQEMNAWLYEAGGLELWRELYAPFNLIPFPGGNTGVQMAGWFNKEIRQLDDIKGLRMRIPGLGGEVFQRVGGEAVNIAGGDLYTALQTGVIDGTEWVGPYNDLSFGFQDIAQYYYYPGWHEPGSNLEFIVNKDAWEQLPKDLQAIFATATQAVNAQLLNEYTAQNNRALQSLINDEGVHLKALPNEILSELKRQSQEVIKDLITKDDKAKEIYQSYQSFAKDVAQYHDYSEFSYYKVRHLETEE